MTPAEWKTALEQVPEERQYDVIERAAIHEYLGGMDRDSAERSALAQWNSPKQAELLGAGFLFWPRSSMDRAALS